MPALRIPARHQVLTAGFSYAVLVVLAYAPVVLLGRAWHPASYDPLLAFSDAPPPERVPFNQFEVELATSVYYEFPVNRLVGRMYWDALRTGDVRDHLPLWNPHQGIGVPLAAQYSTRTFFPYQVAADMAPCSWTDLFMLGRVWLAGLGTFLFLRRLPVLTPEAAFIGGCAYMLSGTFTWFGFLEQMANVAIVLPYLLWAFERLAMERGARALALAGLAVAAAILGGQPEVALVALILAFTYAAFRHATLPSRERAWGALAARAAGAMVVGLGLSAPLWVPFLELTTVAHSLHPVKGDMGTRSVRPFYSILILLPTFFADETHYRLFPMNGAWDHVGGFCGLAPMLLVAAGVRAWIVDRRGTHAGRPRFLAFFLASALFWILKSFGLKPLVEFGRLPLLDQVWTPRWAGPIWTFCLGCAAAYGFDMMRSRPADPARTLFRSRLRLVIAGLFTVASIAYLYSHFFPSIHAAIVDDINRGWSSTYHWSTAGSTLVALLTLGLFAFVHYGAAPRWKAPALLLLLFGELSFALPRGYPPEGVLLQAVPLAAVACAVLCVGLGRIASGALFLAASLGLGLAADAASPMGFPQRKELFPPAARTPDPSHREIGCGGVLFPCRASGIGTLHDAHLITSLCPTQYMHYYNNHLLLRRLDPGNILWFSGVSDFPIYDGLSSNFDVRFRLPFYSAIGVRDIWVPSHVDLLRLPVEAVVAISLDDLRRSLARDSRGSWPLDTEGESFPDILGREPLDGGGTRAAEGAVRGARLLTGISSLETPLSVEGWPSFSASLWVNPAPGAAEAESVLLDTGHTETENLAVQSHPGRGEDAWVFFASRSGVTFRLPEGRWTLLTVVADGRRKALKVFLDGVFAGETALREPLRLTSRRMSVGGKTGKAARFFRGAVDEVAVWDRPLTDAEVAALWGRSHSPERAYPLEPRGLCGNRRRYLNPDAAPRARIVHRVRLASSWEEAQAWVGRPDFDPVSEAVLEVPLPRPLSGGAGGVSAARITVDRPNRVGVEAESAGEGLLVLADLDYPGWTARVDGEPAEILRVNGLVRGVPLSPGKHAVEFLYRPFSFEAGVASCAAALLVCAVFLLRRG